jgi:putative spermidine/putrescine transport system substrate-binding protein
VRPTVPVATTVGEGEGSLNLVAWSGYAENGTSDPRVDWVQPFEKRTRCRTSVKYASSTRQMVDLMSSEKKRYDGVTAPPEVAWQLISGRHAAPVNPDLVDGFESIDPRLRAPLKVGRQYLGVPYTWGANALMYDPKAINPAPTGWAALFDPAEAKKRAGRLVVRDSPLTLADAALSLRERDRSLGIKDPFDLNRKQLRAASSLLAKQRPYVRTYWNHPSEAIESFAGGGAVLGQVWPYHLDVLGRAGRSVTGVIPESGVTGWVDAWMIGARAENRNCMYQWLNWVTSPDVQQQVAEWSGVAPANPKACEGDRLSRRFCDAYHVDDRQFIGKVDFAHPPRQKCPGGECATFAEWSRAWQAARK